MRTYPHTATSILTHAHTGVYVQIRICVHDDSTVRPLSSRVFDSSASPRLLADSPFLRSLPFFPGPRPPFSLFCPSCLRLRHATEADTTTFFLFLLPRVISLTSSTLYPSFWASVGQKRNANKSGTHRFVLEELSFCSCVKTPSPPWTDRHKSRSGSPSLASPHTSLSTHPSSRQLQGRQAIGAVRSGSSDLSNPLLVRIDLVYRVYLALCIRVYRQLSIHVHIYIHTYDWNQAPLCNEDVFEWRT